LFKLVYFYLDLGTTQYATSIHPNTHLNCFVLECLLKPEKKNQVLESTSVRPSALITSTGATLILTKFFPVGVLLQFSTYSTFG